MFALKGWIQLCKHKCDTLTHILLTVTQLLLTFEKAENNVECIIMFINKYFCKNNAFHVFFNGEKHVILFNVSLLHL